MTDSHDAACSVYMFDSVGDMLSAARAVAASGDCTESSAFFGGGSCWLALNEKTRRAVFDGFSDRRSPFGSLSDRFGDGCRRFSGVASEFGVRVPIPVEMLDEHFRRIAADDAVGILSPLA